MNEAGTSKENARPKALGKQGADARKNAGASPRIADSTASRCTVAAMAPHYARLWIRDNPEPWARMKLLMLADVEAGRRTSIMRAVEEVRAKDYANIDGRPFKVNNSICPALARLFVKEHPEAAPFIETRRSMSDGLV